MNLTDSDTFMHYFNMSGRTLKVDPKFFLFSAHAETVAPLLHFYNLQANFPLTPAPSSMMVFDIVDSYGTVFVRGKFIYRLPSKDEKEH